MATDKRWRDDIAPALEALKRGGVILYPTDTIWGLGCDATNSAAIEKISLLKHRNTVKGMIILVDSPAMMERYTANVPPVAYELVELSDKPLTLVLPARKGLLPEVLLSEDCFTGIRVCREPFCSELIARLRRPIVSTSANFSDSPAPQLFAKIDPLIIDSADYVVKYRQDDKTKSKPSPVIRVDGSGAIKILRR